MSKNLLIGVFVRHAAIEQLRMQKATYSIASLYKEGLLAGNTVYFFSEKDVDLRLQAIAGSYLNVEKNTWQKQAYPFPDVLYNRRSEGKKNSSVQMIRQALKKRGIKSINPINDFNKWELYRELAKNPLIAPHLPQTICYGSGQDIQAMLSNHNAIYLKAVIGRYSRFVMRIKKQDECYEYSFVGNRLVIGKTKNWQEMTKLIRSVFDRKDVILQQAIDVFTVNNCNVDMRAELQRNRANEVKIVANSARVGSLGSPVTSTRADAEIYKFDDFSRDRMGLTQARFALLKQVDSFLFKIYKSVEDIYGTFGEMGIDFALDKDFRLWLIECNAKSAKVAMFLSYGPDECEQAFRNPMEYARLITGLSH